MPKRYNNDIPHREPGIVEPLISPETLAQLACEIGNVFRKYHGFARVREMVRCWRDEWKTQREAELDFERDCRERYREHARKAEQDERLRDKKAGPPYDGWQWGNVDFPRDASGELPATRWISCWAPRDLSPGDWPDARFPLPLPARKLPELTLPEKYAALAAVHDFATLGTTKIDPWKGSKEGVTYSELVHTVENIPEKDAIHLRGILDEIREDLSDRLAAERGTAHSDGGRAVETPHKTETPVSSQKLLGLIQAIPKRTQEGAVTEDDLWREAVKHGMNAHIFNGGLAALENEGYIACQPAYLTRNIYLLQQTAKPSDAGKSDEQGQSNNYDYEGYACADWFRTEHGIPQSRLSELSRGNNPKVRSVRAPKGHPRTSEGKQVRVLYHIQDALKHCSPKHVKQKSRQKLGLSDS